MKDLINKALDWLAKPPVLPEVDVEKSTKLAEEMLKLNADPYLHVADFKYGYISVFDELRYDRGDMDFLSGPMRAHALKKLAPLGFKQTSGTVISHRDSGVRIIMPKMHALGASPFDIARYSPKGRRDYYLLTPTQTACLFVNRYSKETAFEKIKELVQKHPVNLLKLVDHLERRPEHDAFKDTIGHLRYVQREAVESDPLRRRRALGSRSF